MTLKQILTLCSQCRNSHGFVVCIYTTHVKRKKKNTSVKEENEDTRDMQEQDIDAWCFSLSPLFHSQIMTRAWLSHSLKSMAKFISIRTNFLSPKPQLVTIMSFQFFVISFACSGDPGQVNQQMSNPVPPRKGFSRNRRKLIQNLTCLLWIGWFLLEGILWVRHQLRQRNHCAHSSH